MNQETLGERRKRRLNKDLASLVNSDPAVNSQRYVSSDTSSVLFAVGSAGGVSGIFALERDEWKKVHKMDGEIRSLCSVGGDVYYLQRDLLVKLQPPYWTSSVIPLKGTPGDESFISLYTTGFLNEDYSDFNLIGTDKSGNNFVIQPNGTIYFDSQFTELISAVLYDPDTNFRYVVADSAISELRNVDSQGLLVADRKGFGEVSALCIHQGELYDTVKNVIFRTRIKPPLLVVSKTTNISALCSHEGELLYATEGMVYSAKLEEGSVKQYGLNQLPPVTCLHSHKMRKER